MCICVYCTCTVLHPVLIHIWWDMMHTVAKDQRNCLGQIFNAGTIQEQCKLISWSKSKLQCLLDSRTSRVCTGIRFLIQISNIFIFTINHWALPPYVLALNRKDPDFSKLEPINIPAAMGLGHWDGSCWSSWCCPFLLTWYLEPHWGATARCLVI